VEGAGIGTRPQRPERGGVLPGAGAMRAAVLRLEEAAEPSHGGTVRRSAGSNGAKGFILLHELAHATGAAGPLSGDKSPDRQTPNNQPLLDGCGKMINGLGANRRPSGQFRR
jgi:hypothetical protein